MGLGLEMIGLCVMSYVVRVRIRVFDLGQMAAS